MTCLNLLRRHVLISAFMDHTIRTTRTIAKNAEMRTISTSQANIIEILAAILRCLIVKVPCSFSDRLKAKLNSQLTFPQSLLD